uniref:RING-type E3 ubiquitin transferase n=1 Tax=Davidia involucrata TaxID=16924 RepID=A0A5B7B655_DAVIN
MMSAIEGNPNIYNTPIQYGVPVLSGTTAETLLPMYTSAITDSVPTKTAMKADSGLTYTLPVSRKRSRDSINPFLSLPNGQNLTHNNNRCGSFTFLGEDISLQIQQQQLEIDRSIAQHTEKVRLEAEERRKQYSRRIVVALEEGIMKKLRAKEEEIEKIGRLNWALEERVKSLCIENQIWRDLAQTNEATANALRSNLEQVLAQAKDEQQHHGGAAALMDDAQSCCGSNNGGDDEEDRRTLAGSRGEWNLVKDNSDDGIRSNRWCRNCGKEESCVLLLPCRHLCLCTVCGSSVHTCPICKSNKNASLHVNMSS